MIRGREGGLIIITIIVIINCNNIHVMSNVRN